MSTSKPGVLVIGGDFQGVGVLRALGKRGVPTYLVDHELCIGRFSRHRGGFSKCPEPTRDDGRALAQFLLELGAQRGFGGWVLIPNNDEIVRAVSLNKQMLETLYRVPVPAWDTVRVFAEKRRTHDLAERLGIPVPRTRYPGGVDELDALDLSYPLIVKPISRDPFYSLTRLKAVRANTPAELRQVWEWACGFVQPDQLMVQELISGGTDVLYSLGCHYFGGRLRGRVVAHRARQHPMEFGRATTFAETVDIPEIEEMGARLLEESGYEGLAEVEFMFDRRDDTYRLLEVNPRVWGWHTLAGRAGVDLPYLLYADAAGEDAADVPGFATGAKWLRPITDFPTAVSAMFRGRLALGEYLRSLSGPKELAPALAWDDPAPFAVEFLLVPYLLAKRGF